MENVNDYPVFSGWVPRSGRLLVAAYEESSQLEAVIEVDKGVEGIEQKFNALYMDKRRNYRGWIVAVGQGVLGVEWGDEVALKPWGGRWWNSPFRAFDGRYTNAGYYQDSASGHVIFMDSTHYLLECRPEMVIYRHKSYNDPDNIPSKEEPLFNRLHVQYLERDHGNIDHRTGLVIGGYGVSEVFDRDGFQRISRDSRPPCIARVLGLGMDVDREDFSIGDWVLSAPDSGTIITNGENERGMIEAEDIIANFGAEKPAGKIEWTYFSESICA